MILLLACAGAPEKGDDTAAPDDSAAPADWADVIVPDALDGAVLGGGRLVVTNLGGEDDGGGFHGRSWTLDDPAGEPVATASANLVDTVDDLDGDGLDEWTATDWEFAYLYDGASTGALGAGQARAVFTGWSWPVDAGDLDGDGVTDLAAADVNVVVYSGLTTGSVDTTAGFAHVEGGISHGAAGLDLDGDGADDLLYESWRATGDGADLRVVYGPVLGTYADTDGDVLADLGPANLMHRSAAIDDLDGDGLRDLAVAQSDDDYAAGALVVYGSGGAELARVPTEDTPVLPTRVSGDTNGDGRTDLVVGTPAGAWLLAGPVAGTVDLADATPLAPASGMAGLARLGDLDGDGLDEAFVGRITGESSDWSTWPGELGIVYGGR